MISGVRTHLATLQKAVTDDGVSLGSHSINTLKYEGHGTSFLVETGFDEARTLVVYHPRPSALPAGVPASKVYDEILAAAQVLNDGRAKWGDEPGIA